MNELNPGHRREVNTSTPDLFSPFGSLSCIYQAQTLFFIQGRNTSAALQQWPACYRSVSLLPPFQEVRVIYDLIYMRRKATARLSRAAEGKSLQEQIQGSLCLVRGVQGPMRTVGVLLLGEKKEPPSIQPVNFPSAVVCSGAAAEVASRRFISPSKRPSH